MTELDKLFDIIILNHAKDGEAQQLRNLLKEIYKLGCEAGKHDGFIKALKDKNNA